MGASKFVSFTRKVAELGVKDMKLEVLASPRTAKKIKEVLGPEGLLTFLRLFLAYNLPLPEWQFIVCMDPENNQILVSPYSVAAMKSKLGKQ